MEKLTKENLRKNLFVMVMEKQAKETLVDRNPIYAASLAGYIKGFCDGVFNDAPREVTKLLEGLSYSVEIIFRPWLSNIDIYVERINNAIEFFELDIEKIIKKN